MLEVSCVCVSPFMFFPRPAVKDWWKLSVNLRNGKARNIVGEDNDIQKKEYNARQWSSQSLSQLGNIACRVPFRILQNVTERT